MKKSKCVSYVVCLVIPLYYWGGFAVGTGNVDKVARKEEVLEMFNHAYNSYMTYAYPADELMPLSCKGRVRGREPNRGDVDESLGNFSLTLIDTLDTLAVLGLLDEFEEAVRKVIADVTFDADLVVSVFETNIRVVGGLLGGHTAAKEFQEHHGRMAWYRDELLHMAKEVGYRLLPAFNTTTGVPYPKVNLRHGLGKGRPERDTCTACAGTMLLEFSALSRLSGDPIFEEKARSVMHTLWSKRQRTSNLVGTVINIHTGDWVRRESGVGAGIDSYYEYLLKGYILLGDDSYLDKFNTHYEAVRRYISDGPLLMDVQMHRPHARSRNFMDALLAFWPGLQVLFGDIEPAIETHEMLYQVTQRHNFLPEAFTPQYDVYWAQHPLRPEFTESTYMLYKATSDPYYLEVGEKIVEALQNHARVHCGFAGIKDVRTGSHEDRMDSFVLAETFKYLYLLFAEPQDLVLDIDRYLLTTEAHILPLSISKIKTDQSSNATVTLNVTHDGAEGVGSQHAVVADRSCANHKYLFPGGSGYAQALRDPVKKARNVQSSQCPSNQQPPNVVSDSPRLKAAEFVPGNPDHMQQLTKMGIRLITMKDGRVQLMHTAANAVTPQSAEQGALFMQEMIELSKSQQAEVADNHPRVVQVMAPDTMKNMVLAAGPAQFGMDLNENFAAVGELVVAEPFTACSGLTNGHLMQGKIILMSRGECMFVEKARHIQKFGAHGGIVVDNVVETSSDTAAMFAMSGDGTDDVNIPLVFLFSKEGAILLEALKEHSSVEVLLLDKAKTLNELNEIWGHYHSEGTDHALFKIRASVESVQVSSADQQPSSEIELNVEHEYYDEDGDEEYECPASSSPKKKDDLQQGVDVMEHHRSGDEAGAPDQPRREDVTMSGRPRGEGDSAAQQVHDYLQELKQFALTKSDIGKLLAEVQGDVVAEATTEVEKVMKAINDVNKEAAERLELGDGGGGDGEGGAGRSFYSSATPAELQIVFNTLMKQYLDTSEGQQLRADRAESALKHQRDSYDDARTDPKLLESLTDLPRDTINTIVREFIELEKIRLKFDKMNPLHNGGKYVASTDTLSKSNQDSGRTNQFSGVHLPGRQPSSAHEEVPATSSSGSGSSDGSNHHIPHQPPQQGGRSSSSSSTSSATSSHSGTSSNKHVDPQLQQRREMLLQRAQELQQQVAANLEKQQQEGGVADNTGSERKDEL